MSFPDHLYTIIRLDICRNTHLFEMSWMCILVKFKAFFILINKSIIIKKLTFFTKIVIRIGKIANPGLTMLISITLEINI